MKLEVGMFIRTTGDAYEPSKIGKIKEVDIVSFKEICYRIDNYNKHILIPESFIKKSSFNLIDLIEVGDYVNGEYMLEHYLQHDRIEHTHNSYWYEQDIKEILTHEQYEANAYKVVE